MIGGRLLKAAGLLALLLSSGCASDRKPGLHPVATINAPREWRPAGVPRGGVLLVHGLGDSPWSFSDLGPELARQGFLVRSILLPGHGTIPEDMLEVTLEDWRGTVSEQTDLLIQDAGSVYLGGFSTGANLVLDKAYATDKVAGLLLFSPAFRSSVPFGWVTPLLRYVRPWLIEPVAAREVLPTRYSIVPTNGFAQFYRSSRLAQRHLDARRYDKPVLMVLAAADSVVDTDYAVQAFQTRFTHPQSRLVWYGSPPKQVADDARFLWKPDDLPELKISQFSHMGVLFSPDNPLYGSGGTLRICHNGHNDQSTQACLAGSDVWFSEWGYEEPGKVHARLTFNPHFAWQTDILNGVMSAGFSD